MATEGGAAPTAACDQQDPDGSSWRSGKVFIELDDMVQESALQHMESLGIKDCRKYISAKIDTKGQELYVELLDSSVKFRSS
eukprot:jgi/Tetstr1/430670/TSEL_020463.t1